MISDKQIKKNYFWNFIAGIVNAAEAVIMSMVVTRVTGVLDAGILAIAFSVGNLLMCIGKYGIYNFQVTDVKNKYAFSEYFLMRIITVFLMMLSVLGYLIYGRFVLNYDMSKIGCIFFICLIYAFESYEDVFNAWYQKHGRLDLGCKIFCLRWCILLFTFSSVYYIKKSLLYALVCSGTISVLISIVSTIIVSKRMYYAIYGEVQLNFKCRFFSILELFKVAFPLFAISFLSFYVINAPKYSIDKILGDEIQACYGFVAMPVFVIGLLNSFVYHPTLVDIANEWKNGENRKIIVRIKKQLAIIVLLCGSCFGGAALIGVPVLSWLYHTDISAYYFELLALQIAGGFLAVSGYLAVVMTVMRYQKDLVYGYIVISLVSLFSMDIITKMYGVRGVVIEYTFLMALLCIIYFINLLYRLQKNE